MLVCYVGNKIVPTHCQLLYTNNCINSITFQRFMIHSRYMTNYIFQPLLHFVLLYDTLWFSPTFKSTLYTRISSKLSHYIEWLQNWHIYRGFFWGKKQIWILEFVYNVQQLLFDFFVQNPRILAYKQHNYIIKRFQKKKKSIKFH